MLDFSRNKKILAFVHIEKSAGTTLIHILRRNYIMRYCDVRPLSSKSKGLFRADDLRKTMIINPFIKCIAGHSIKLIGDLSLKYPQIQFIILMRDPIKRYISQYQHWVEKKGRKISFEEFLATPEVENFQTKKIAGCEDISLAKEILLNRFFLVGTLENFDEFLVVLKKKLRPIKFDPTYRPWNLSNNKRISTDILSEYHQQIVKKNKLDIELYNFLKSEIILANRTWYGESLSMDIVNFIKGNQDGFSSSAKGYYDYAFRKLYIEPIGSLIRWLNGLPSRGSY